MPGVSSPLLQRLPKKHSIKEVNRMPAFYAHYRFGKALLPTLPADVKQCIHRFRRLYDMGLQGPDLFFYYNPLMKTAPGELGGQYHRQSGRELFGRAAAQAGTEGARAYLYGLLGHYCLDSACHGFVEKMVSEGKARHVALESEFDRYLMAADGIPEPHAQDHNGRIKLTRGECVTVAEFYPPTTPGQINRCQKMMRLSFRVLAGKNRRRTRRFLSRLDPGLCDSMIPEAPVEEFARMDSELLARFNRALKHYPVLLEQLSACMDTGEELGEDFTPTFG